MVKVERDINIRNELYEILVMGKTIKRFVREDLPTNLINDNVYSHTIRTIQFAKQIEIDCNRDNLIQTLLIHDIPEIYTLFSLGLDHDVTTIEKHENPVLRKFISDRELKAATSIFNVEEHKHYTEMKKQVIS